MLTGLPELDVFFWITHSIIWRDKILHHPDSYAGRRLCNTLHRDCNRTGVTWPEFVGHVIKSDVASLDSHWFPVSLQCGLCSTELQYDLVIKLENLHKEWGKVSISKFFSVNFPLSSLKVSSLAGFTLPPIPHMNRGSGASQGDDGICMQILNSFSAYAERYIGQLSQNDLENLYRKYYMDFKLFGYTFTNWRE